MSMRTVDNDDVAVCFVECRRPLPGERTTRGGHRNTRFLGFTNHCHLFGNRTIAMNNTQTSELAEGNRHARFRHAIHCGGEKWDRELYPSYVRFKRRLRRLHPACRRSNKHVVEGESLLDDFDTHA